MILQNIDQPSLSNAPRLTGCSCCSSRWIRIAIKSKSTCCDCCKQNQTKTYFSLDLGTKRIECRYCLTGEVSILLGADLFQLIPQRYWVPIPSPQSVSVDKCRLTEDRQRGEQEHVTVCKVILICSVWEWTYTLFTETNGWLGACWQAAYMTQTYTVTQQVIYLDLLLSPGHSYHTSIPSYLFLSPSLCIYVSVSFVCGCQILCKTWVTAWKTMSFSLDTRIKPNPNLIRPIKSSLWWWRAALLTANHWRTHDTLNRNTHTCCSRPA